MPDTIVHFTVKRKIRWDPEPERAPAPEPEKITEPDAKVKYPQTEVAYQAKPARNGNGHKRNRKRALTGPEKDAMRAFFMRKKGCIQDEDCVTHHSMMDQEVTIFQVTGFISYLHRQVACGSLTFSPSDQTAYVEFMKNRHDLWATYNSPKYVAMRKQNTGKGGPVYTTFPSKIKYAA